MRVLLRVYFQNYRLRAYSNVSQLLLQPELLLLLLSSEYADTVRTADVANKLGLTMGNAYQLVSWLTAVWRLHLAEFVCRQMRSNLLSGTQGLTVVLTENTTTDTSISIDLTDYGDTACCCCCCSFHFP